MRYDGTTGAYRMAVRAHQPDEHQGDGEGNRVAQQISSGGTTTTTVYVGSLEEVSTTGSATTTTTSYYVAGKRIAEAVNGVFSYLGTDGLGKRTSIERFFGRVLVFFRLQRPPVFGWHAVETQVALTYAAVWVIALAAWQAGHPELLRAPRLVLAHLWEGLD